MNKKVKKRQMQKKICLRLSTKETYYLNKRGEKKDMGLLGAEIN